MSEVDPVVVIRPAETVASPEERKAQELYAERIESEADAIPEPGVSRAHRDRARVALSSLPWAEFRARLKRIREAERDAGVISGVDAIEIRGSYSDSIRELEGSQLYNPTMQAVLEYADSHPSVDPDSFLGVDPGPVELAGVAAARAILGLDAVKAVKPLSDRERIDRAVAKEMAPLSTRTYLLRKELDEFKESRGIR